MADTTAVAATGNFYIDGVLGNIKWTGQLTYSFPDSSVDYETPYVDGQNEPTTGFSQFSPQQIQAARQILEGIAGGPGTIYGSVESLTNLSVSDAGFDGADLRLGRSGAAGTGAYAYDPGPGVGGDVWFGTGTDDARPVLGNYAYQSLVHEIGHALGLVHAHESTGFGAVPGDRDALEFATMSYRSYVGGDPGGTSGFTNAEFGFPQTFMMLDIAALQYMYGADFGTNAGNTTYTWSPTTGEMFVDGVGQGQPGANVVFLTIWDGDGVDTYDMSNYTNDVRIDLTPGAWSLTAAAQRAELGPSQFAQGTVYNALQFEGDARSLIEYAIGGSGNDIITGNVMANRLTGGAGNDVISGLTGNDTLDGGAGADSLYGGPGDDTYHVETQGDLVFESPGEGLDIVLSSASFYLYAGIEKLTLASGSGDLFGVGNELANTLTGNEGVNLLIGWDGADTIAGGAGNDVVYGVNGNDSLLGEDGVDVLIAGEGADTLDGGTGPDLLYGEGGNDVLFGGTGFATDILVGGAGNDVLDGSAPLGQTRNEGDYDLMYGGTGDDTYYVDTPADLTFEMPLDDADGTDAVIADITGAGYYLYGGVEQLTLTGNTPFGVGNELANTLTGSELANWLLGGAGDDTLNGKGGNDVLFGEAGSDTFVFERGTGGDVIGDFTPGTDKIRLVGIGYSTVAEVKSHMVENGPVSAIDLGAGDFVVLHNVTIASLSAGDFVFG